MQETKCVSSPFAMTQVYAAKRRPRPNRSCRGRLSPPSARPSHVIKMHAGSSKNCTTHLALKQNTFGSVRQRPSPWHVIYVLLSKATNATFAIFLFNLQVSLSYTRTHVDSSACRKLDKVSTQNSKGSERATSVEC